MYCLTNGKLINILHGDYVQKQLKMCKVLLKLDRIEYLQTKQIPISALISYTLVLTSNERKTMLHFTTMN